MSNTVKKIVKVCLHFNKNSINVKKWRKHSWKFVYISAKNILTSKLTKQFLFTCYQKLYKYQIQSFHFCKKSINAMSKTAKKIVKFQLSLQFNEFDEKLSKFQFRFWKCSLFSFFRWNSGWLPDRFSQGFRGQIFLLIYKGLAYLTFSIRKCRFFTCLFVSKTRQINADFCVFKFWKFFKNSSIQSWQQHSS